MDLIDTKPNFEQALAAELDAIARAGLTRELRRVDSPQGRTIEIGGRTLLNFSSNDYLGLANHPALREAAARAIDEYGAGAGASRLICGSMGVYHQADEALGAFKGTEAALSFSSGFATALGTVPALVGKEDVVILDKLVHASIVDAARLSGAKLRVFKHNDVDDLASILAWADSRSTAAEPAARRPRVLVVTESVFSMDGDLAPLREIVDLKERHGAWLMVDEAHGTGLFGERRRGVAEACGVSDRIEVQMGTLGKAVGAAGGYICGSRRLIDLLINRARSFIFSTAPPPAQAAAALAGLTLVQSDEGARRCDETWSRLKEFHEALAATNLAAPQSPIVPILIGAEDDAMKRSAVLRDRALFVPAIRYPTVARNAARLRVTLTASHTSADVTHLANTLNEVAKP